MLDARGYWIARLVLLRGLGLVCLIAFLVALNQFRALCGARGLLPATNFMKQIPYRQNPSLFYLFPQDLAFTLAAWAGVVLSCLVLTGISDRYGTWLSMLIWALLWVLYMSFVNVGQTFYGFGWETLLLEAGFFAIFLGGYTTPPSVVLNWIWRWVLFRVMFGAGPIKLRGDPCWRDLTCLDYYFETQPIPNALSWYFHWMPHWVHRAGVVFNHVVELGVPFLYFLPQPIAGVAALVTIVFQLVLIASGNLSWLNWITIVVSLPLLDDRWWTWLPVSPPDVVPSTPLRSWTMAALAVATVILSIRPALNLVSTRQRMNASFNPLHLVNTYGAFGSIGRDRAEIVIEGTSDRAITPATAWQEYEFKGKPGDRSRMPPQIAPYHLRLDWLMWFAAMGSPAQHRWFQVLLSKLLAGDSETTALLRFNPFPDLPPRWIRASLYEYRFTTPAERRQTGHWWHREPLGLYWPPARLQSD